MHRVTGDHEKVMQVLKGTMDILQRDHAKTRRADVARMALKSDSEWSQNRDEQDGTVAFKEDFKVSAAD